MYHSLPFPRSVEINTCFGREGTIHKQMFVFLISIASCEEIFTNMNFRFILMND
jgi:hypothetical protein